MYIFKLANEKARLENTVFYSSWTPTNDCRDLGISRLANYLKGADSERGKKQSFLRVKEVRES